MVPMTYPWVYVILESWCYISINTTITITITMTVTMTVTVNINTNTNTNTTNHMLDLAAPSSHQQSPEEGGRPWEEMWRVQCL